MTRAVRSLRTRLVVMFVTTLVLIQVANAAYLLIAGRRAIRLRLETAARQFAVLATPALAQSFDSYFNSGYFKFRQFVVDLLARSDEVTAILVCDVDGHVLFDSRQAQATPQDPAATLAGERLLALRRVEPSEIRPAGDAYGSFEIVVPYVEDWGRHRLSALYHVSLAGLEGQFRDAVRRALALVALSGVLAALLGLALGTRLTRPLAALTEGVEQVARGNYDKRLQVESRDECRWSPRRSTTCRAACSTRSARWSGGTPSSSASATPSRTTSGARWSPCSASSACWSRTSRRGARRARSRTSPASAPRRRRWSASCASCSSCRAWGA
jgi:HAMP domain-containing protein